MRYLGVHYPWETTITGRARQVKACVAFLPHQCGFDDSAGAGVERRAVLVGRGSELRSAAVLLEIAHEPYEGLNSLQRDRVVK